MADEKCKQLPCIQEYNINVRNTEMNSWREEECPSPADTYIEWCFQQRCRQLKGGFNILTEWRTRKRYYISILETVSIDFQHFSRHDDTHSINILEAIEMLLGKARVDMLSAGDLWLLLECAYAHDTGMAMTDKEIRKLWIEDQDFRDYVKGALDQEDHPNHEHAQRYQQIDKLLKKNQEDRDEGIKSIEELFPEEWPVELCQSISLLMSDYIRSRHSVRVWETWGRRDDNSDPVIPKRLDRAVQTASELHGNDFKCIISELDYCCKGFGNGIIHPRFAAAMLRMGDILDLDNNRFNPRTVERFGTLPYVSMLHYKKHQAITHLAIKDSGIEVKAVSDDIEVCKVLSEWFEALKRETNDLICNWNEIVPEELKGCLLKPSNCEIYLGKEKGKKKEFESRLEKEFQVDKDKLINLLGNSIYSSSMDFIREYLQNALDATKMQLWKDWKNGKFKFNAGVNQNVLETELSPFDFGRDIYDQYEIQIEVSLDVRNQKVKLSFIDHGIGMEQECIEVLAKVGTGWRGRKEYNNDINAMPKWLRPTGGFGIGVQSAFMVTDKVTIITRDKDSSIGRKIVLYNSKRRGRVTEEGSVQCERGTTIEIELDLKYFYESAHNYRDFADNETKERQNRGYEKLANIEGPKDFFDSEQIKWYIVNFLKKYIAIMIPDALFPIRVIYPQEAKEIDEIVKNKFFPQDNYWNSTVNNMLYRRIEKDGEKYHFFLQLEGSEYAVLRVAIWDIRKNAFYCFLIGNSLSDAAKEMRVCYKNVLVKEEVTPDFQWLGRCGLFVDYMGFRAEEVLKAHRDKFNDTFKMDVQPTYILNAYKVMLRELEKEKKDYSREFSDIITSYLNRLDTVMLRLIYLGEEMEDISMDEIKGDIFIDGSMLRDVLIWDEGGCPSNEQFVQEIVDFLQFKKSIIIQSDRIGQSKIYYSISTSKMMAWNELREEEKREECNAELKRDGAFKFFYGLQQCGNIIIRGRYADLLIESVESPKSPKSPKIPMIEVEGFQFNNSGDKYAKLTMKCESLEDNVKKIFSSSYKGAEGRGGCYVAKNLRADFFPNLQVHYLPFSSADKTVHGMIISPISRNAYREINRMMVTGNALLKLDLFMDCITKQDDYEALIEYVYDQQRRQRNYLGKQTVDEEYREYIRKIHEVYIEEGLKERY